MHVNVVCVEFAVQKAAAINLCVCTQRCLEYISVKLSLLEKLLRRNSSQTGKWFSYCEKKEKMTLKT